MLQRNGQSVQAETVRLHNEIALVIFLDLEEYQAIMDKGSLEDYHEDLIMEALKNA